MSIHSYMLDLTDTSLIFLFRNKMIRPHGFTYCPYFVLLYDVYCATAMWTTCPSPHWQQLFSLWLQLFVCPMILSEKLDKKGW